MLAMAGKWRGTLREGQVCLQEFVRIYAEQGESCGFHVGLRINPRAGSEGHRGG